MSRQGKPEFTPTIRRHQPPRRVVKLHMRAIHLATLRQIEEGK